MGKAKLKIFVVALVALLMGFISTSSVAYYSTVGRATALRASSIATLVWV